MLLKFLHLFLCLFCFSALAQEQLKVTKKETSQYPKIELTVECRNPDGIDTATVVIVEGDKSPDIQNVSVIKNETKDNGVCALILFENHYSSDRNKERDFFKTVIRNSANDIVSNSNDCYYASFDWSDSKNDNKVLVFGGNQSETHSPDELISWSEGIEPKSSASRTADYGKSTKLYRAISEGIDFLNSIQTDKPKFIIVLSGEFSARVSDQDFVSSDPIIAKSLSTNVPIYSVGYDIGMTYKLDELCKQTFGMSATFNSSQIDGATDAFKLFFKQAFERSLGKSYAVTYQTTFPKDGENHSSKISASNYETNFDLKTPNPGFLDWVKENKIVAILIGVLIIGIIMLIFILFNRRKKDREIKEAEHARKLAELENQSEQAKGELIKQKEILQHKDERERIQAERILAEEQEKARKKKEDEITLIMSQGGFPRLSGEFRGQHGELVINKPIVSIGRKEGNYYTLNHPTVSGSHAEIRFDNGKYLIRDLNSSNGTMVNGRRIQEQELKHGDIVNFGEITMTYLK